MILKIKILTKIINILVPPRWILEPTDKAFAQGSDAKIECKADGFPRPMVTWKKAAGQFREYNKGTWNIKTKC